MLMIQPYTHQQPQLMKSLKHLTKSCSLFRNGWPVNKLVLNIPKTKSIVFGINHSLSYSVQLNLVMNGVAVEQVEETKLFGVTLDCKLSWSKRIDSMLVKRGRGLSVIKS